MKVTDMVKKFLEAEDQMFSTGDGSALLAIEDPNITVHMFNVPDMNGNQAHVDAVKRIRDSIPGGVTHVWADITGSDNIGAFRYTGSFKSGGKDVSYQGAYFLKVKDGKITEAWLVSDMLTYFLAARIVQYAPAPTP